MSKDILQMLAQQQEFTLKQTEMMAAKMATFQQQQNRRLMETFLI